MIADLLSRYYEGHGKVPEYNIIRSIVVDGHETAWMLASWPEEEDKPASSVRMLLCECHFQENVGWVIGKDGQARDLDPENPCLYREAALYLKHLELRLEYVQKYGVSFSATYKLIRHAEEIILDLITKVKAGDFVEYGAGAYFWGGYFYLGSVAAILGAEIAEIWTIADKMVAEKKICLEGAVVQEYNKPPSPSWEEYLTIEKEGWKAIALLPAHSRMSQVWKLEAYKPDGSKAFKRARILHLGRQPIFGPDVDDVTEAKEQLERLLGRAMKKAESKQSS